MDKDERLEELLKPLPFDHSASTFFLACNINEKRGRGLLYWLDRLNKANLSKKSQKIEFVENALDLTRREQLLLAFKVGKDSGD